MYKYFFSIRISIVIAVFIYASASTIAIRYDLKTEEARLIEASETIKESLWFFDNITPVNYLEAACSLNNYKYVEIHDNKEFLFLTVNGPEDDFFDRFIQPLKLGALKKLAIPIVYKGQDIGIFTAFRRVTYVRIIFGYLLITGLGFIAVLFFDRTLMSKKELQRLVDEQTSELNNANQKLENSVKEKSVLLQEVHHRVKNNLGIINSLLNLQKLNGDNEEIEKALTDTQNRIDSMAVAHEKLYQSESFSYVILEDYLSEFIFHLVSTFTSPIRRVTTEFDVDYITLPLSTMISLGLIINEIVTNSMKHAFSDTEKSIITISAKKQADNKIKISAADNGCGFDQNNIENMTDSAGKTIISALINQLNASIQCDSSCGTKYTIVMPID